MLICNTETISNKRIVRHLGLVQGSTVQSKHIGRDFMAGLKNIVGGELRGFTELLEQSRDEAGRRMVAEAEVMGANAIVAVRFSTTAISQGASEILVYGTAVIVEEIQ